MAVPRSIWFLSVCVMTALTTGCTWKLIPPAISGPEAPVFVTAYSKHTRIALPDSEEKFVEFGFGEWNYYALENRSVGSAVRAAFFARESALSRRELPWTLDNEEFQENAGGVRSVLFLVNEEDVQALRDELQGIYDLLDGPRVYREWEDLHLVQWDEPYHLFHNSNNKVVEWLQQLGFQTRGWVIMNEFVVEDPAKPELPST